MIYWLYEYCWQQLENKFLFFKITEWVRLVVHTSILQKVLEKENYPDERQS